MSTARALEAVQHVGMLGDASFSQLVRELQAALRCCHHALDSGRSQGCEGSARPAAAVPTCYITAGKLHNAAAGATEDVPAACGLLLGAAQLGLTSLTRQLLLVGPTTALNLGAATSSASPLHTAALDGRAVMLKQMLAAAPEAVTTTCMHGMEDDTAWSLMHSAAAGGSAEALQAVLALPQAPPPGRPMLWTRPSISRAWRASLKQPSCCCASRPRPSQLPALWATCRCTAPLSTDTHRCSACCLRQVHPALTGAPHTATPPCTRLPQLANASPARRPCSSCCMPAPRQRRWRAQRKRPLHCALRHIRGVTSQGAARLLLPASGLTANQLLDAPAAAGPAHRPLYADLAAQQPLSAAQWQRVPARCMRLGRALPAVLARSDAEAGHLVRCLSAADQHRLCLAQLCLARAQRRSNVVLHAPLLCAILARCLAE